jgi:hypothetical protein
MPTQSRLKGMLRSGKNAWPLLSKWMPWLCIGVILILVYYGIADILVMAADAKGTATLTAAELKDRIDELKWILGLIVTTAGLFTVAQSVAAGFTARSFTEQAEKSLAEARARFKVLGVLEEAREQAAANLTGLQETLASHPSAHGVNKGFNWQRSFYQSMPLQARQALLSVDRVLPYELVGRDDPSEIYAANLRRLALFYWAKFIYERNQRAASLGDLERSQYLIDLAIGRIGRAFYLLNDMGNILFEHYRAHSKSRPASPTSFDRAESQRIVESARRSFEESIRLQKRQLRAHFNLALLEAAANKAYRKAIDHLQEGLRYEDWEAGPVDEYRCNALYNLACYYARLLPRTRFTVKACLAVLKKAARLGVVYPPSVVDRDFNELEGDFYAVISAASPAVREEFKRLEPALTRNSRQ